MWCDHPFNQRNKTTEKVVGVGFGGDREGGGGWTKFEKGGGRQYNKGVRTPLATMSFFSNHVMNNTNLSTFVMSTLNCVNF